MRILRRRPLDADANEIAMHAAKHSGGGAAAAIISAIALLFSGYSLWETSLKKADLSVYVPGVITYARDGAASVEIRPSGGFEVFAVPITIANSGARDAAVVAVELDVKNIPTGLSARFEATYIAEPSYFNPNPDSVRQKTPFSALVIAGRSAWRGTVVFYPVSYSNGKALTPELQVRKLYEAMDVKYANELKSGSGFLDDLRKRHPDLPEFAEADAYQAKVLNRGGKVEVTLKLVQPAPTSWLDRLLDAPVPPIRLTLEAPNFWPGSGEIIRVRRVSPGS